MGSHYKEFNIELDHRLFNICSDFNNDDGYGKNWMVMVIKMIMLVMLIRVIVVVMGWE